MTVLFIVTARILKLDENGANYIIVACTLFIDFILLMAGADWLQDTLILLQ